MAHCIFCPNELTTDTKPEHILPNALGGRKTTRGAICSNCNGTFGSTIDKRLTSQVEIIRNMLQLESGTGKKPPMLRNIQSGKEIINFRNDGTPEQTGKPFTVTKRDDGIITIEIRAKSGEELRKITPHIAAEAGCSVKDIERHIENSDVSLISKPVDMVQHRLSFGGTEPLRSITKTCLVLWGTVVGNEEVRSAAYADARQFVVSGNENFNQRRIHLDSRYLPCDEALKKRFGDIFNLVYLKSNAEGRLICHVTIYNAVSWQIVLVESGAVPNVGIGLVSNPLDTVKWSDTVANEFDIDFDWLDKPAFDDFAAVQKRFSAVVEQHFDRGRLRELGKIVDGVCGRHGITDNEPIPDALLQKILAEIGDQVAHYALKFPYERPLSSTDIKNLLKRK